jgi:asparagine synthase (glutamine-hydrolysing)
MVSDVPVGIFLSGGYDSSIVTAILQANHSERIKTFTIGFTEKKYNEAEHAKKIATFLGTDHVEYYCSPRDVKDLIPLLPDIWDEPFGDSSAIPTILVSRLARKQVTVSLSADGGDEIFGGYNKYYSIRKIRLFPQFSSGLIKTVLNNPMMHYLEQKEMFQNVFRRAKRLSETIGLSEKVLLSVLQSTRTIDELVKIIKNHSENVITDFDDEINTNWLDNILAIDYKTYLIDDILTKVDRATMSVSLEGREPMLDHRIIEYTAQLPPSLKIKNGCRKYMLKQIAHKYIPKKLLKRPKMGFMIPVHEWCRNEMKDMTMYYLDKNILQKDGIFDAEKVLQIRDSYLNGQGYVGQVWFFIMFQMWKERWF